MQEKVTTLPNFNPSNNEVVADIKNRTEEILQLLLAKCPDNRCRAIAMTNYEQAAMWAVKSNFT